jgi:hypothetical protein
MAADTKGDICTTASLGTGQDAKRRMADNLDPGQAADGRTPTNLAANGWIVADLA